MRARVIVAALLAAIGVVGAAGPANAQTFAVKVGANGSNITQDRTFKPDDELVASSGFMVGLQTWRAVHRLLQLQVEGLFTQKGNSLKNDADDLDNTIVVNYLEMPVLARVSVIRWGGNAVSLHGGPTFAVRAGTRETNNGHGVEHPVKLKTFDMGIAIGGQVELKKLLIGARYTIGLSNMFADDPNVFGFSTMKNRALTVFAGYGFR